MKHKIWWLIAAGVLLTGVGLLGAQAALAAATPSIPGGYDLIAATAAQSAAAPSPEDFTEMQAAVEGATLSWWAAGHGTLETALRSTTAEIYAVTGAFQDFHHMDMLYGSFLPRTDNGGRAAVLDNGLAFRLFGTENAVGMELEYEGLVFQVCGVCRTDDSLLGLMSGSGQFRAYLTGGEVVAVGKMAIGGFEATIPRGAPGEGLQNTKTAMADQGMATNSWLLVDKTEQQRLTGQASALPGAALSLSGAVLLLVMLIRWARAISRESVAIVRDDYFRNVWPALLWRLAKLLLLGGACAGLAWLMWESTGLELYVSAKYIPGSWIDMSFYTELIRSESQAAIAEAAYGRQWWDSAVLAAQGLGRGMYTLAVLGAIVTALSMRALWADRRLAAAVSHHTARTALWDVPALWGLLALAFALTLLLANVTGLPVSAGWHGVVLLGLTLGVWAAAMHREKLDGLLCVTDTK